MSAIIIETLRTARARGERPIAPNANLSGADLWDANLWGTQCGILAIPCGVPSGAAILTPTPDGWTLRIGCWTGTADTLRAIIATDDGWPEATGDEVALRRPILAAVCNLADAHIAYHADIVPTLAEKWGAEKWEAGHGGGVA